MNDTLETIAYGISWLWLRIFNPEKLRRINREIDQELRVWNQLYSCGLAIISEGIKELTRSTPAKEPTRKILITRRFSENGRLVEEEIFIKEPTSEKLKTFRILEQLPES